jgi:hypothetical protein
MQKAKHKWWEDDKFMKPPVRNSDNERLQPSGPHGHVSEVNGAGAQEFPEFHPTRHELIALAKYWAERAIDLEYWSFLFDWSCNYAMQVPPFAWARVNRIRRLLGDEVDTAIADVYQSYGAKQDKKVWEIYRSGSKAERAALQEEMQSVRNWLED